MRGIPRLQHALAAWLRIGYGPARQPQLGALWRDGALRAADDDGDLRAVFGECVPPRPADGDGVFRGDAAGIYDYPDRGDRQSVPTHVL